MASVNRLTATSHHHTNYICCFYFYLIHAWNEPKSCRVSDATTRKKTKNFYLIERWMPWIISLSSISLVSSFSSAFRSSSMARTLSVTHTRSGSSSMVKPLPEAHTLYIAFCIELTKWIYIQCFILRCINI